MNWAEIPSLAALRAFEATARLGSFTKAAAELNVTHAAIAQHVRGLENHFAQALVARAGRGLILTEAGARFAKDLQSAFAQIAQATQELRHGTENRALRISLTQSFAALWLMPRLNDFWAKHPEIELSLHTSNTVVDLARDDMDMAIRFGTGSWPGVQSECLMRGDFCVVGSAGFVTKNQITSIRDPKAEPWLVVDYLVERIALLRAHGVELATRKTRNFDSNELVIYALEAGVGLSVQPYSLVRDAITSGTLCLIEKLDDDASGYYAVTRPGRETKALRLFLGWLRKEAARETS